METVHNGFYLERDCLQDDLAEACGFEFMDIQTNGNKYQGKDISAYDYLHGMCNLFAAYLQSKYNYQYFEIYGKDSSLIHSFCTKEIDEVTYYIDVRGYTSDYKDFIEEFEEWISCEESRSATKKMDETEIEQPKDILLQDIQELIYWNPYYKIL